jgi:hypothetical protein
MYLGLRYEPMGQHYLFVECLPQGYGIVYCVARLEFPMTILGVLYRSGENDFQYDTVARVRKIPWEILNAADEIAVSFFWNRDRGHKWRSESASNDRARSK